MASEIAEHRLANACAGILERDNPNSICTVPFEPYLSKTELAAVLGYSRRWVEIQVANGAPSIKLHNGHRRFRMSEFEAWLVGDQNP